MLEIAVLGVISLHQPCSGYGIRKVFERSPSGHWSGSTGAIYPLLRRLEKEGLIQSALRRGDGRSSRSYRLSRNGKSELVKWLQPPLPDGRDLMPIDPLRVRVRFLGVLSPEQRLAVIHDARATLKQHMAEINSLAEHEKNGDDTLGYLSHRSAILSMKAQLAWLDEVEAMLLK
jgi:DNA-binding PadR family transcriptional regulator